MSPGNDYLFATSMFPGHGGILSCLKDTMSPKTFRRAIFDIYSKLILIVICLSGSNVASTSREDGKTGRFPTRIP